MHALPHEKLDVYRVSLQLAEASRAIIGRLPAGHGELADQLRRATFSVPLNIAEGCGEFSPNEKTRSFRMALRSATEAAAVLDLMELEQATAPEDTAEARELVARVFAMLTVLAKRKPAP